MSNLNILNYEISTPKQLMNGTRIFQCPHTGDLYGSYESGYVRRKAKNSKFFYQLNPTIPHHNDDSRKVRVMVAKENERLKIISRISNKRVRKQNEN